MARSASAAGSSLAARRAKRAGHAEPVVAVGRPARLQLARQRLPGRVGVDDGERDLRGCYCGQPVCGSAGMMRSALPK